MADMESMAVKRGNGQASIVVSPHGHIKRNLITTSCGLLIKQSRNKKAR
jgi:hypothetical protein